MSQHKFIDRKEELEMLGYDHSRNDSSLFYYIWQEKGRQNRINKPVHRQEWNIFPFYR